MPILLGNVSKFIDNLSSLKELCFNTLMLSIEMSQHSPNIRNVGPHKIEIRRITLTYGHIFNASDNHDIYIPVKHT